MGVYPITETFRRSHKNYFYTVSLLFFSCLVSCTSVYKPFTQTVFEKLPYTLEAQNHWQKSPFHLGSNTLVLTVDGEQLNQLIVFSNISSGSHITDKFSGPNLPRYDGDLTQDTLNSFAKSSIEKIIGQETILETIERSDITDHPLEHGILVQYQNPDGLEKLSYIAITENNNNLYVVWYDAPKQYYFGHYLPEALDIIGSIRFKF